MKRGIYLVANLKSQDLCSNLIYSIRNAGCSLPIRLIHFGGERIQSIDILREVELLGIEDFPAEANQFISRLEKVLTECPVGYLYRYLAWFSDWDEFIYSDNDIVALGNWEQLFKYTNDYHIVHADEEYTTKGKYNYDQPEKVKQQFGERALETAITAGHFLAKRDPRLIDDMEKAMSWYLANPGIAKKHDQAFLHVSSLIGKWRILNLCKHPFNYLSSWAGDYKNPLQLVHAMQSGGGLRNISHLHYSGGTPDGNMPIQEFLFSDLNDDRRLAKLISVGIKTLSGVMYLNAKKGRALRRLKKLF